VKTGEVPWQVALVWKYLDGRVSYPFCGATIISRWHVVTAAHCTAITMRGRYAILYGSLKNYDKNKMITVETIVDHPNYNKDTFQHDIAVLKLQEALVLTTEVSPACLPDPSFNYVGKTGIVSGWGHTEYQGTASSVLLKVEIPVASDYYCRQQWSNKYFQNHMICNRVIAGKDSCQGDSGGPFVVANRGSKDLVGITSTGFKCDAGKAGLYTRVTAYLDWIDEIVCRTDGDYYCSK